MSVNKKAKILDYTAGFFLLVYIALILFKVMQGDYFYLLFGVVSFALFLLFFSNYRKTVNSPIAKLTNPPKIDTPKSPMDISKKAQDEKKQVKEFRQFLQQLADSKHIEIKFDRESKGGHMDLPEVWLMEKPIPLTPEELYKLTFYNRVATIRVFPHDDGIIYAHQFYFEDGDRIEYQVSSDYFTAQNQTTNSPS